jgi:uncharacterized protein YcnI/copper(I)-binding protein
MSAVQAFAHTSFVNGTVTEESTTIVALQVPHGCDGKATTEVQIKLPEGFISAKPQPKAGWDVEIIKGDYKKSYDNHGSEEKSGPVEIRWKNGSLPDEFYDTFVIQGKVSGVTPGTDLPFLVTQLCGANDKVSWNDVAPAGVDPHSLKNPAPVIRVAAKDVSASADAHNHHAAASSAVKLGDLELTEATSKAMLPGQPVGGGFVTISNTGKQDDRLISATSSIAGKVELHEMAMANDVMKMRKLDDGIAIPAGETVKLTPGGLHFMFFQVKKPFAEGDMVPVRLTFEKAGEVEVMLSVQAAGGGHQHN